MLITRNAQFKYMDFLNLIIVKVVHHQRGFGHCSSKIQAQPLFGRRLWQIENAQIQLRWKILLYNALR
ncbi:hypothetical protein D3C84_855300 [compost metagenome]